MLSFHNILVQVLMILIGLVAVYGGLLEARRQRRMRRSGVHSTGVVVRYEITQRAQSGVEGRPRVVIGGSDDYDPEPASSSAVYAPVVQFTDEHGIRREFRGKISSSFQRRPVGSQVPVAYQPGHPETARLDTLGYKATYLALTFGAGAVFIAIALWSALTPS